ncbi:MAG: CubicO group peptidase (beta-lactamase class C family), partial [Planctomycetota bacterium]
MSSSPSHMFDLRIRFHTIAMLLLALTWGSSTLAAQESKEFQGRLKTLDALLETQRLKLKIPGFAVAIVKDDKVVFAKGYGQRDIAGDKPVDTKTIFAIGSTTKAFTSTLVGMMVDQGEMKWDDPVTKFLPNYKMQTEPADATVLIRDLLCHRTGFRRMGLLWAGGQIPLDEVITRGGSAESTVKFRSKFMYNNVTYMTAGVCAASLTKGDWDAMVTERILKPLGMKDTTTSIAEAKKNKQLSLGYKWDEEKEEFVHQPMRDLYSVRPSGSINSNVDDMVQWLRLQLGKGKFGDKRLISEKSLGETWKKQMAMGGGAHYGLGWMLRKWEKKDVVEHGGNIDGFAAEVAFLPELNTGFVLLMNVGRTPLQQSSIELIFDALYGEKKTKNADAPQVDKSKLVGDYVGNFGPFVDTTFKVTEKDGQLFVDVPGQTNYELKDPDEKGEWFFAITDTIVVTFNRDDKGQVLSLTMAQGGMKPEYLRTDVDHKLDSTAAELEPLLGKYSDEKS